MAETKRPTLRVNPGGKAPAKKAADPAELTVETVSLSTMFTFEGRRVGPGEIDIQCNRSDEKDLGSRMVDELVKAEERYQRVTAERMRAYEKEGIFNPQPTQLHFPIQPPSDSG